MEAHRKKSTIPTYGEGLKVLVGPEEVPFFVHEGPIRASSKFFDNAMKGPWNESTERCVRLRDDDPEIFSIYQHWLYSQTLSTRKDVGGLEADEQNQVNEYDVARKTYSALCDAYCLGEKLMDDNFKNTAIDAIIQRRSSSSGGTVWAPGGDVIAKAYKGTPEGSLLRKLLVDFFAYRATTSWWYNIKDLVPEEFISELCLALLEIRPRVGTGIPWTDPVKVKSLYHTHPKK